MDPKNEEVKNHKERPKKVVFCRVSNADYKSTWEGFQTKTMKEALEKLEPILVQASSSTKSRHLVIDVFLEGQEEVGPFTKIEINVRPSKSRKRRQDAEKLNS